MFVKGVIMGKTSSAIARSCVRTKRCMERETRNVITVKKRTREDHNVKTERTSPAYSGGIVTLVTF